MSSSPQHQVYQVEHLATFSTASPQQQPTTPKMALQRLFAMEKTSGIWTQRMAIQVEGRDMKIIDGDSSEAVERFPVTLIQQPTAFNHNTHIYDNILIFTVQHPEEAQGELHIFQCNSHSAQQVVEELKQWMRRHGNIHVSNDPNSPANVNVKETVHVFNAIAAQRETRKSTSPAPHQQHSGMRISTNGHHRDQGDSRSITTTSSIDSSGQHAHRNGSSSDQSLTNERFVSILNHCFDDIERFIIRLQHAAAALRELQLRNHKRKGHGAGDGLLAMRARGPSEEEFFEILAKFKLAFNLLAKLKGCIHDPNAPELVHFLFTPLAIIIDAARSNGPVPVDPSVVGVPFLNPDAIELLANCCTSKEYDLWQSLSINWTQPVRSSRIMPVTFQPVFSDGWAPTITEPELMGFSSTDPDDESASIPISVVRDDRPASGRRVGGHYEDSDADDLIHGHERQSISPISKGHHNHHNHSNGSNGHPVRTGQSSSPSPIESESLERDSPAALTSDIEQVEWLAELQSRNAKVVKVLFPRTANNDKELSVVRGEILEVMDDSRKWWKARNCRGQVAHVPHTIVSEAVMPGHPSSPSEDWIRKERQGHLTNGETMSSSQPCDRFSPAVDEEECHAETSDRRDPRLANLISSIPCLQLITSHLFHRGFTSDFLSALLIGLQKDESATGVPPLQALLRSDKKLLQGHLNSSMLDETECKEFYETLVRSRRSMQRCRMLHV